MTVKEILKLVCEFVGEKELMTKLQAEVLSVNQHEQEKLDCMVRCFNLVNQEIASDYLPFLAREEVKINGSILNFSDLKKVVINIYEIKNKFGMNLNFKLFPNFVEISGKAKTVVYSFLPDELSLNDTVEKYCGLSARVYAYGVASEYLLIDGVGEDAEIWENRFKDSLFVLSRKKNEHILPNRRWF